MQKNLLRFVICFALLGALSPALGASIQGWDPNGTTSIGGSGSWDTTTKNWTPAGTQTQVASASLVAWTSGNVALFCAGPSSGSSQGTFSVTVNGAVTIGGIDNGIDNPGSCIITLNNGTSGSLNLPAATCPFRTAGTVCGTTTINVPITGTGPLQAFGCGGLILGGANTFTGGFQIDGTGGVSFGTSSAFGTGTITWQTGGFIQPVGTSAFTIANPMTHLAGAIETYAGNAGGVTFSGAGTLGALGTMVTLNNIANTVTISGALSGAGGLVTKITSPGVGWTLSGANTYTGPTTNSSGTLTIGGAGKLGNGSYSGIISNGGQFVYNSSSAQTLSGIISGTGNLTKSGTAALTLTGNNSFSGGVNFLGGALMVGSTSPLGTGPLTINGVNLLLRAADATARTVTNPVSLSSDITLGASGSGNLTFSAAGPWTVAGPTRTINVDTISATISGVINGGASAIVKSGSGTLNLFAAGNNYGSLTVNAGTVAIGNNTAIPPSSSVTLSGGTMALSSFPTASALFFGSTQQAKGTWGSTFTSATHKDNTHFGGTGVITITSGGTSTVSVSSDNNPSTYGSTVNLTATVIGSGSAATPTGTVTFYDAGSAIGTSPVSGSGTTVTATLAISTLSVGAHNITATYSGDPLFDTSTSSILVQTVNAPVILAAEYFFPVPDLPPSDSVYVAPPLFQASYGGTIIIKNAQNRNFTVSTPPPSLGSTQTDVFSSEVDLDLSLDGGATFSSVSTTANVQVKVAHSLDAGGTSYYDTEMLQLDASIQVGASVVMLRESPTLQSTGKTTIRAVAGGSMISSFFDVFTEVSMDGGATWTPASSAHHMELRKDPKQSPSVPEPTSLLPPPNDHYVSPAQWHALYAQGIVIKDVSHRIFTQSQLPPPPGTTNLESFNSQVDMQISTDGGNTFQVVRVGAPVQISVVGGSSGMYDTEMLQLDLSSLPSGIMVRESPSLPSRGGTQITAKPDGTYQINSFFDVFTEVSLDGGATWSGATNGPVRMELHSQAPENPANPSPNLPPLAGGYVSPAQWHALYANGIIITNASHDRFTQNQPPPPPGGNQLENFGSTVHGLISMDGGATFQPFSAPANVSVQVNSHSSEDNGGTRFFDTEMLSLALSGGSLPGGVMVRESPSKASLGRTSVRQDSGGQYHISSFFDVFTEVSLDGGATWSPSVTAPGTMGLTPPTPPPGITCPSNITVRATSPAGAVVYFTVGTSGGCPPVNVIANPPSGSTFPVGTTTVNASATDNCGQSAQCSFTVTVLPPIPEYFTPSNLLPPPSTVYISPALWHVLYNNGIVIRDVRHRFFTQNYPPPPLGAGQVEAFGSEVDYEVSFDNGATFTPASGTANVQVKVTHSQDNAGTSFYDTEMLQLDLTGPGGTFMLRESPTLQSTGQTTIRPVAGGYMVSSFFDVFTEISTDGGASWTPAQQAGHVELRNDPETVPSVGHPTPLLPPPGGVYVSPQLWQALFAQGIVIKDVSHKFFTTSLLPPTAGSSNVESFNSIVDLDLSLDGGATFQFVHASAPVQVTVTGQGSGSSGFYDTEMTSLSLSGLPGGIMIRESPSLPSRGGTEAKAQSDGSYKINSFFDIFTEVSVDGGATWSGATNGPVRMQLTPVAPEVPKPNPNLPPLDGTYISPQKWHALYANGIIITNASHNRFTQTQPPPPPGGSQTENFASTVNGLISMDGGASFQPFSAPASVMVQVQSRSDEDNGSTRFFDTEMLALSLSGGNLPGGVMVRESPSKASLGRTSVRAASGDYQISSFFDIFTEVSLDGGATWSPSVTAPGTMGLAPSNTTVSVTCSSNITVTAAACANGAVVFFSSFISNGCAAGPGIVTCNPPSGSFFPVGTTTVTCTGCDACGVCDTCSFTVTVLPATCPPLVLTCSTNITVNSTNCGSTGAVVFYNSSATGGCTNPTVVCNPPSGSTFPIGTTTVTCTASDGCGNSTNCNFTVTVNPCPAVVLACSSNIVVNATNCGTGAGANVFYASSVSGGCGPATFSCNPPSGSFFPIGTTTVTCSAFDCGVVATNCSFTVTVNPPVCPPIVLTCSSNLIVTATNCGSGAGATVFYASSATGGCAPTSVNCNPPSGSTFAIGTTTVTCVATDACGNKTNCSFTVTVNPCPAVVLTCSSNIVVNATNCGTGAGANVFYASSVSGGCGPATFSCNPPSGSFFPIGTTTVTCSAFDCGVVATNCSFTVTVNPPVCPPIVLTCSTNIVVNNTTCASSNATVFYGSSATGGCAPTTVNCNPPSGSSFPIGTTTVTCIATDACGNKTNCSFTVTVNPCPPVVLTCSSNIVVNATNCGTGAGANVFYPSSVSGGCGPATVSCNPPSGSFFPLGTTTVTCSAFDCGVVVTNCSFTVTVKPPVCPPIVLTCSSNLTVATTNCGSGAGATVFYASSATGGCAPTTVNCNPPSGSTFPIGTTTVTCIATDACGNKTNCSFTVTVNPCPAVVLTCSSNIVVTTTNCSSTGATVFFTSSVSGGCGPATLSCNPPSGSTFPLGTTTVTCSAFDCGVVVTNCSFTVTVNPPVCPPLVLTCSSNITVTTASCNSNSAVVFYSSSASGGCNPPPSLFCTPPSGSTFPIGTTTVTCTASNSCGQITNCSFTVTVKPPTCPPIIVNCSSNLVFTNTGCSASNTVVFYSSTASGGCAPLTLTCNPPSGSSFPPGISTVTCTAVDACGNSNVCSFTVTIAAGPCPPIVLNCSSNMIVTLTNCASTNSTVFFSSTASGGCAPLNLTCNPPSGSTFPLGTSTVTCTATDACGHTTNCSFTVTVNPPVCPPLVLNCSSNIVVTTASCTNTSATVFFTSSASGGCNPPPSLFCTPPSGSSFPLGITTVTCTASNSCGQITNCSFTVTVNPPVCPPLVLNCSSNIVMTTASCTNTSATVFFTSSASGGCNPPPSLFCTPPSGSSFPLGITTVTCTASNSCGQITNCSFTVTVKPPTCPPITLTCSTNITINATNCSGTVPVFYSSSASGGCGPVTVSCNPPSGSGFPVNASALVTCTATDACGNSTNCSFAVTVNGPHCSPIVLTCSSNITVTTCSNNCVPVFFSSAASGGCGPVTVTCNPPSGSCFNANASTLVTCTATDSCGNTTNCTFAVTVNSPHCPPLVLNCPKKIKVVTKKHFGAFVFWTSTASGGCPPVTVTCSPPSGSFFPVGTTLVTCTACDSCGHCTNCSFFVTVLRQQFVSTSVLPVTNTVYISPATWHALYAGGIVIRDVRHRFFTTGQLPPPLGTTQIHTFNSQLDFELSTDNGNTFQQVSALGSTTVSVTHSSDDEGIESYDTEMLSLDVQGLPNGMRLRESPTLQSLGQTSIEPTPGGYMISSFFDIFTEISLDGGQTWTPADDAASVEMRNDPRAVAPGTFPTQLLPSPAGAYVSPQQWHALFAQGIVIKDVKHKFFTQSLQPPPPTGTNTETFNSTVDMQISMDGGNTFQYARVSAPVQVTVTSLGSGNSGMYETEMTQLDISGSGLPGGIMLRESPSKASIGGTQIDSQPDGTFRVNSFFDIFTEISLDGGNTWAPTTNGPVRMELTPQAIEVPASSPSLPVTNAPYISPAQWHALYANGIIITNVTHRAFTQTTPPPPPGASQLETFGSTIDGQLSLDGGKTFISFTAPATAAVQVTSRSDQDSSGTRHFDTEMLSLSLSGGNLPGGIMVRESPSKASLGRTSIRPDSDGNYRISSFFDIFTEVSLDGGSTWSPSTTAPATMAPRLPARKRFFTLPKLPPTNGQYISPKQWHALYANGISISNVTHRRFLANFDPPPKNSTNIHNFGSQVNFLLKMPGQSNFIPVTANADCQVSVGSSGFQSKEQVYQTEMLALNLSGGSLPPGVMIRESPTKRSTGETHYTGAGNGYRISSFFDVFTEISTDGGGTWSPASAPGSMELHIDPGVPPTTVVNPRINNGIPTFTLQSQLGLKYLLQYKDDLLDPTWTTGPISSGTGDQLDLIDCCPPPGPSRPHRFYRVEVQEDDSY
jgi:autotransporter-associated beta strand protein